MVCHYLLPHLPSCLLLLLHLSLSVRSCPVCRQLSQLLPVSLLLPVLVHSLPVTIHPHHLTSPPLTTSFCHSVSPALPTSPHGLFPMTLAYIAAHCHLSSHSTSAFFCCLPSPPPLAICFHCLSCQLVLVTLTSYACKYVLPMTSQDFVSGLHSQPFLAAHHHLSTLLPPTLFTSFQYLTCWPLLTFMLDHVCHLSLPDCLLPPAVASPPASTLHLICTLCWMCLFKPVSAA